MTESLWTRYPELAGFLGAYFPETDYEGISDEQAAKSFASFPRPHRGRTRSLQQGRQLLEESPFPFEELGDLANRNFTTAAEARAWLEMVLRILAEYEEGPDGSGDFFGEVT